MKWKLYKWCCVYNIAAMSLVGLAISFLMVKEGKLDGSIFIIVPAMSILLGKQIMSYKLYLLIETNTVTTILFGVGFYFLWFLNLAIFFFASYGIVEDFVEGFYSNFFSRNIDFQVFTIGQVAFLLCSAYILSLDISLERKIKREADQTSDLLSI